MEKNKLYLAGLIIIIIALVWFFYESIKPVQPIYFDDSAPVMYFYADGCSACQAQAVILQTLGEQGYRVKPMDVGAHPEYVEQYGIVGTPTFISQNETLIGVKNESALRVFLDKHNSKLA